MANIVEPDQIAHSESHTVLFQYLELLRYRAKPFCQ